MKRRKLFTQQSYSHFREGSMASTSYYQLSIPIFNSVAKIFFSLFIILLIAGTVAKAQSADEKAVAEGVKLLNKGLITRDKRLLENIAAPELSYGHSTGDIQNKAQYVDAVMKGEPIYRDIIVSDQTIKIAGDNAIVRQMLTTKVTKKGVNSEIHIGNLLVWHKYNGQWKLMVKQGYKLQ